MTRAGGIDMPGEVAGTVALEELAVHGWDLAKGTGRAFDDDDAFNEAALSFYEQFSGPDSADQRGDAFGPVKRLPDSAPAIDRVIGLSERDPKWSPSSGQHDW